MSSPPSEEQYLEDLRAFYANPSGPQMILKMYADMPQTIQDWLGKLCLLYGLPFNYLVPHESMLPEESIRFFFIDHNWLDSLVDGAFSIGTHSSRDTKLLQGLVTAIREAADVAMPLVRSSLKAQAPPETVQIGATMTGLLLRSALVSGWPGLEVKAYGQPGDATADKLALLPLLRMDRLATDVLLCIFSGLPERVEINEPLESLHFGIEPGVGTPLGKANGVIVPRSVGSDPSPAAPPAGTPLTTDENLWVAAVWRQQAGANTRVLNVSALRDALNAGLSKLGAIPSGHQISPAEFAIQMVKAPEQQEFD
ncbi:MAG TPA: hypothetical protein VGC89_08165 [Pyrinomonadaceae bacterium]